MILITGFCEHSSLPCTDHLLWNVCESIWDYSEAEVWLGHMWWGTPTEEHNHQDNSSKSVLSLT